MSMLIPKTLPYPVNFGLEALSGHMESEEEGVASLGVLPELLALKGFMIKLKEDVDSGIRRVERVLGSLDLCGPHLGAGDGLCLGGDKDVGCSEAKPKRKKRKNRKKKKKISPLGPKPKPGVAREYGNQANELTHE